VNMKHNAENLMLYVELQFGNSYQRLDFGSHESDEKFLAPKIIN
jgi:hypothetical protein